MHSLGLSAAEERILERSLARHHRVQVLVRILTTDGDIVTTLTDDAISGQVNCSVDGQQTRYLQMQIHARNAFAFEADGEWDGALNFNREIQVVYVVKAPLLEAIEVPVFTGPVVDFDRSADMLDIEAAGREWYAQGNVQRAFTIKKGADKVEAIKRILRDECGETRFAFPDLKAKLPKRESLDRDSVPWEVAQKIARSMDRQLFYDGAGVCRLRAWPKTPTLVFRDGNGGLLRTEPTVSPSMEGFANRVRVRGGEKKQAKQRDANGADPNKKQKPDPITYVATAPRAHPMSPWALGRNGQPRFVDHVEDNSHIRTTAGAKQIAVRLLNQKLAQTIEIRFDSIPAPHLDVGDWFRYSSEAGSGHGRLREFTLPLDLGEDMTINYRNRRSQAGRRRRTTGRAVGRLHR